MKRKYYYFIFLLFIFLSCFFVQNSFASDLETIDYQFNKDILYTSDNFPINTSYNLREQKEFKGNYNATYSFENEIGLKGTVLSFVDSDTITSNGGDVVVVDNIDGHGSVLNMSTKTTYDDIRNYFDPIISGSIEFWIRFEVGIYRLVLRPWNDTAGIYIYWYNGYLKYIDSVNIKTTSQPYSLNRWYHYRIVFNCSVYSFDVYANGVLIDGGNFSFYNNVDNFAKLCIGSENCAVVRFCIDALGYSWEIIENSTKVFNFNNESIGVFPNDWINNSDSNCYAEVIDELDVHYKPLKFFDESNSGIVNISKFFSVYEKTGLQFDFTRASIDPNDIFLEIYSNNKLMTKFVSDRDDMDYYDGSWKEFISDGISPNYFTTIFLRFYSTYFNIYVNGSLVIESAKYYKNYYNSFNELRIVSVESELNYYWYLDNISITEFVYNVADNLLPKLESTGYYEVDKTEFRFKTQNELYPIGYLDDIHNWHTFDTIDGYTKIDNDQDSIISHCIDDYDTQGIQNENFNYSGNFINVSFVFKPTIFNDTHINSRILITIHSLDESQIFSLFINSSSIYYFHATDTTTKYYLQDYTLNNVYTFNMFLNYEFNNITFDIYENSIFDNRYYINMTYENKYGLKAIFFRGTTMTNGKDIEFIIYSVSVYCNGISYASDYGYIESNTQINTYNCKNHYLTTINATGYFSIAIVNGIYTISETYQNITKLINFNGLTIRNSYDFYTNIIENGTLLFFLFGQSNFSLPTFIQIEGSKLVQDTNIFWLEYSHNGIDIDYSYFYVDSIHNLRWYHYSNDTNTEYIKATFDINDTLTTNYSLGFSSYIQNNAYAYVYANYTEVNQEFQIYNYLSTRYYLLVQNYTLNKINILITDNDNDDVIGLTEGYIREIKLLPIYIISYDLVLTDILFMMIPLIVILIPSFLIGIKYKNIIVPMILIMSMVCLIAGLIPLWLFFIIIFSGIVYFITNRERDDLL